MLKRIRQSHPRFVLTLTLAGLLAMCSTACQSNPPSTLTSASIVSPTAIPALNSPISTPSIEAVVEATLKPERSKASSPVKVAEPTMLPEPTPVQIPTPKPTAILTSTPTPTPTDCKVPIIQLAREFGGTAELLLLYEDMESLLVKRSSVGLSETENVKLSELEYLLGLRTENQRPYQDSQDNWVVPPYTPAANPLDVVISMAEECMSSTQLNLTPEPTSTLVPASTPTLTATAIPTPTSTPIPTPGPTSTATPVPDDLDNIISSAQSVATAQASLSQPTPQLAFTMTSLPIHSWDATLEDVQRNLHQCLESRASIYYSKEYMRAHADAVIAHVRESGLTGVVAAHELASHGAIHNCWRLDFGGDLELLKLPVIVSRFLEKDVPDSPGRVYQCLLERADPYQYSPQGEARDTYLTWVSTYANFWRNVIREEVNQNADGGYALAIELGVVHACWTVGE